MIGDASGDIGTNFSFFFFFCLFCCCCCFGFHPDDDDDVKGCCLLLDCSVEEEADTRFFILSDKLLGGCGSESILPPPLDVRFVVASARAS